MIFKLFKREKDHRHYLTKAGKHLAAERYADARVEYLEALRCCPAGASDDEQEIRKGLGVAGNRLGELNLREGEFAVNAGELEKAFDHFTLAIELAHDDALKGAARQRLQKLQQTASAPAPQKAAAHKAHGGSSCGSCKGHGTEELAEEELSDSHLSDEERFYLMVQPLPGDLPRRYAALGEQFARAYLLIHEGNDAAALPILQQLLRSSENDIVIYELALIMYRAGNVHECEKLLNRSLQLNPGNPVGYTALVHLLAETGRIPQAIVLANRMMELNVLADQAQLMLGDLQHSAGDEAAALESWSKALALPTMAKTAAERLVPLLNSQGRTEDAKFLAKKYLKGCC